MNISTDKKLINELLTRSVEEVIIKESLEKKLNSGKKLRIKLGIDPTGSDLHIGHAVPLRKLRQFQEAGHQVILLIGDYTAMIGDPTGRDETRPLLSPEAVKKNEATYIEQAAKVLDIERVEIRHNSEWYGNPNFTSLMMDITSKITVARVLERDDFQKRLKEGSDIQMQEMMYPLLQGYDSVALEADVELGGTDQKFNLLMGRKLQKRYNMPEQDIMTTPLLEGIDGVKKMSKTYDNYIGLMESPEDTYGKTMAVPDSLILKYFELATEVPLDQIAKYKKQLERGENPRNIKVILAEEITRLYHGEDGVVKGQSYFGQVIQRSEIPTTLDEIKPSKYDIVSVLVSAGFCASNGDARRNIDSGGVKVNDTTVESYDLQVKPGDVVQKGKRFFVKII